MLTRPNPAEFAAPAGFLALYLAVDRLTAALTGLEAVDIGRRHLILAAADRNTMWWIASMVAAAAVFVWSSDVRRRVVDRWSALDHGATLRVVAAPLIVWLAWKGALYPYNFHADQFHLVDRVLLVAFAASALWRPAFVIPLVLQFRVMSGQTLFPFQTRAVWNIDELPVIVLLLIAAGHLVFVLTGRRSTSLVVLGISAAIASHFYLPGKAKLLMGWLTLNDVANLPLGSYTAGWLGNTDGSFAEAVSSAFERTSVVTRIATLALELGSLVAVANRRLLRPFLIGWIAFHVVTFITTGFFFIGWVLAEVGLLVLVSRRDLRDWVDENATWPRAAVAMAAVIASPVLFHPPGLAWFDAPVSHGYRIEAVGRSGTAYTIPAAVLAPLDHEVMFKRLQFDGPRHLSGAYGALEDADRLDKLDGIVGLPDLAALEARQPELDPSVLAASVDLLTDFLLATHDDDVRTRTRWLHRLDPPPVFWSSWFDEAAYDFDEPLDEVSVVLLTRVHDRERRADGTVLTRTNPVLMLTRQPEGSVTEGPVRP